MKTVCWLVSKYVRLFQPQTCLEICLIKHIVVQLGLNYGFKTIGWFEICLISACFNHIADDDSQ